MSRLNTTGFDVFGGFGLAADTTVLALQKPLRLAEAEQARKESALVALDATTAPVIAARAVQEQAKRLLTFEAPTRANGALALSALPGMEP